MIVVLLHYSTVLSTLADQNTLLAQRLALLEERLALLARDREAPARDGGTQDEGADGPTR